jgi:pimeloyl-ACP methyl ester carboxylesterase
MIWGFSTFQSRDLPVDTFVTTDKVQVLEKEDEIVFLAKSNPKSIEIIFFQGGLVDPNAYAPFAREIAQQGFTFHLIKASWRFPQYDYEKVLGMFDLTHGKFVVGGHSQGAKTAAQLAYQNPDQVTGLFLMGTTHPRDISLSTFNAPTIKFYAEFDGLASVPEVLKNKDKLPPNANMVFIKGGNHSQFGHMGELFFDNNAAISRDEQQAFIRAELLDFLNLVEQAVDGKPRSDF